MCTSEFERPLFIIIISFLGLHVQHMKVPRLGVKLELYLQAYTTAAAMLDPSCVCDLHHVSQECQILKPLSEARDKTCPLMDPNQILYH